MYEIQESLSTYYNELEPAKRLEILNNLHDLSSEDFDFIRALYQERHTDPKHPEKKNVDWWLWRCVCLSMLFPRRKLFRKFVSRELDDILKELHMNDIDLYSQEQRTFLFHEFKNLARRYLSTCQSDGYGSSFMGLKRASPEEKIYRACEEVYFMSKGIAKAAKLEDKMSLWCEAFESELMDFDILCKEFFEKIDSKYF